MKISVAFRTSMSRQPHEIYMTLKLEAIFAINSVTRILLNVEILRRKIKSGDNRPTLALVELKIFLSSSIASKKQNLNKDPYCILPYNASLCSLYIDLFTLFL